MNEQNAMPIDASALLELIESRRSVGQLVEPAPSQTELEQALQAALSAPDHHRLHPWRFLQVRGEARQALGQAFKSTMVASGVEESKQLEKAQALPERAPLVLVAIMQYQPHAKTPRVEQLLSLGAAVQNMLLMLHAQGYAAIWRTGALATSEHLKQKLNLKPEDEIGGFIYIGSPAKPIAAREPLNVADFLVDWP